MDSTSKSLLSAEVNALPVFLAGYDSSIYSFFNGTNAICVHFLDILPNLSNAESSTLAYNNYDTGQFSSFGSIAMFAYEVFAIQRNSAVIPAIKGQYYIQDSSIALFEQGEAASTLAYGLGTSPDIGIVI